MKRPKVDILGLVGNVKYIGCYAFRRRVNPTHRGCDPGYVALSLTRLQTARRQDGSGQL